MCIGTTGLYFGFGINLSVIFSRMTTTRTTTMRRKISVTNPEIGGIPRDFFFVQQEQRVSQR